MKIRLLVFSHLRDELGFSEKEITVPSSVATASDFLEHACSEFPPLAKSRDSIRMAVNQEYTASNRKLSDGDEVALMPPVQGG